VKEILLVGLGGFLGAIGRYKLGGYILHQTAGWRYPISTFTINIVGCFLMGILAGLAEKGRFGQELRMFVVPGLLGGFTTFSAFAYEGIFLIRAGHAQIALAYMVASVSCGLAGVWFGMKLAGPS